MVVPHVNFLRYFFLLLSSLVLLIIITVKVFIVIIEVLSVEVSRCGTPQTFIHIETTAEISVEVYSVIFFEPDLGDGVLSQEIVEFIFAHKAANVDFLVRFITACI